MPTITVSMGAEDRFWDNGLPEMHTPRWMSSGGSLGVDLKPLLNQHGTMTHVDALSTDDTASYANLDEAGFAAATTSGEGSTGLRIYVKASVDVPVVIPPGAEVSSLSFVFEVVARSASGVGELSLEASTGKSSEAPSVKVRGSTVRQINGSWNRYMLPIGQMTLNTTLGTTTYEAVRTSLAGGFLSVYTWISELTTFQVAYIAAHVTYDLAVTPTTYRRTFPRDDGLAGGARRTFPPSRAVQSSNRTSGYL